MRIIAGTCRGRKIASPTGLNTRPTLTRIKESLFSKLQFALPGARVLDLYAGSGSLGLEALSRGVSYAVFNDKDPGCCAIIKSNLEALGFVQSALVLQMDALAALAHLKDETAFDLVFLDPPYKSSAKAALIKLFDLGLVAKGGLAVVEHAWAEHPQAEKSLMVLEDARKYGDKGLSFFTPYKP